MWTARASPLAPCAVGGCPRWSPGGVPQNAPENFRGPLFEIVQAKLIVRDRARENDAADRARARKFWYWALVAGEVADFIAAQGQNLKVWPRIAYIDEASLECVENHLLILAAPVPDVPVGDINYDAAAEV